ncbi:MAG: cupredoxin domain-containing protein [Candidatus Pacearchaeota archaeon]
MKKTIFYFFGILILIVLAGFILLKDETAQDNTNIPSRIFQGETQKVILSQDNLNYKDVTVKAGRPILLSADASVRGCLRSVVFNIEGKRYSKYLRTAEDTLQLPALKKGIYRFSCSMGMGYGTMIVE